MPFKQLIDEMAIEKASPGSNTAAAKESAGIIALQLSRNDKVFNIASGLNGASKIDDFSLKVKEAIKSLII